MQFKDKTVIVTGGSRDIGRAISLKFGEAGAKVVVNYCNNKEQGDAVVAEIVSKGGSAVAVAGDMTKSADVDKLIEAALSAFGPGIHTLVNNVGGLVARKPMAEMDETFFNHVLQLNITSTFMATKAAVAHMTAGSAIVNLASLAGRDGGGGGAAAYATSKGAVMTFTRATAKEFGPAGIRANCVCPGMISTTFHDQFTNDAIRKNVAAGTPLKREGGASEVADLVFYLASSESSFMTGTSIDINGGLAFS